MGSEKAPVARRGYRPGLTSSSIPTLGLKIRFRGPLVGHLCRQTECVCVPGFGRLYGSRQRVPSQSRCTAPGMQTVRPDQTGGSHAGLACAARAQDHRPGPRHDSDGAGWAAPTMQLRRTRSAPGRSARRRRGSLRGRRSVDGDAASGSVADDPSAAARERAAPIRPRDQSDRSHRCTRVKQRRAGARRSEALAGASIAQARRKAPEDLGPRACRQPQGTSRSDRAVASSLPENSSSPMSDCLDRFVPAAGQEGGVRRAPELANLPRPEGCSPRGRSSRDSRSTARHSGNHTDGCLLSRPGAVRGATCAPANLPCDGSVGWPHRLGAARSTRPIGRALRGRRSRRVLIRHIGIRAPGFVQASGSRRG